jgi:hypothetical protein
VALAISLLAALLLVAALVAWQHSKRGTLVEATHGIEDAVEFIHSRLPAEVNGRLGRSGVRRIVEWEIFYLQGLAQPDRRQSIVAVAGAHPPAIEFIRSEITRRHGPTYSEEDIGTVLELEAAYLESIGAVGEEAGGLDE